MSSFWLTAVAGGGACLLLPLQAAGVVGLEHALPQGFPFLSRERTLARILFSSRG